MAKARNNATDRMSGKVDQFVYRRWNGETIASKKPEKSKKPRSERQVEVSKKFRRASRYAKAAQNGLAKCASAFCQPGRYFILFTNIKIRKNLLAPCHTVVQLPSVLQLSLRCVGQHFAKPDVTCSFVLPKFPEWFFVALIFPIHKFLVKYFFQFKIVAPGVSNMIHGWKIFSKSPFIVTRVLSCVKVKVG
jgi:hypothetical protein